MLHRSLVGRIQLLRFALSLVVITRKSTACLLVHRGREDTLRRSTRRRPSMPPTKTWTPACAVTTALPVQYVMIARLLIPVRPRSMVRSSQSMARSSSRISRPTGSASPPRTLASSSMEATPMSPHPRSSALPGHRSWVSVPSASAAVPGLRLATLPTPSSGMPPRVQAAATRSVGHLYARPL